MFAIIAKVNGSSPRPGGAFISREEVSHMELITQTLALAAAAVSLVAAVVQLVAGLRKRPGKKRNR